MINENKNKNNKKPIFYPGSVNQFFKWGEHIYVVSKEKPHPGCFFSKKKGG